ncbi:MAG: hypothetical protein FJX42_02265 [Alphaproteobacteria bacterium]|nr:hypothetical protein [Alphaproteobacteria bacterium]
MSESSIRPTGGAYAATELADAKIITCIVPVGKGQAIAEHLHREMGVDSMVFNHARGLGIGTGYRRRRGFQAEREVVSALVPADSADEIFSALYHFAGMSQPHNGLVFMTHSRRAVPLSLPDVPEEGEA